MLLRLQCFADLWGGPKRPKVRDLRGMDTLALGWGVVGWGGVWWGGGVGVGVRKHLWPGSGMERTSTSGATHGLQDFPET